MPSIINKTERLIIVDEYHLTPLVAVNVSDAVLTNDRIKALMDTGELESVAVVEAKQEVRQETKPELKLPPLPPRPIASKK